MAKVYDVKVTFGQDQISWTPMKGVTVKSIDYTYGTQPSRASLSVPIIDENVISLPPEFGDAEEIQHIDLGKKECTIEIAISEGEEGEPTNSTPVFSGIVTSSSTSFSEQGHVMNVTAVDYRALLLRAAFFGEYNNKENPASLPAIAVEGKEEDYIPRYTASYILRQIMKVFYNFRDKLQFAHKLLSLKLDDPDGYLGGADDYIKSNSNAVDTGVLNFDGQSCLDALQMTIQAVGNYKLYCDPEGTIWVSRSGNSPKKITCDFTSNVADYNISKDARRVTSVIVKGEKYYFSGQQEIPLSQDKRPNILLKTVSNGWSDEKGAFIVGKELSPGWTNVSRPLAYKELEQPYTITLPDTGEEVRPMVVEEWKTDWRGKTITGIKSARPMTKAEGVLLPLKFLLRGGTTYSPENDVYRRWVAKDIYGERIGFWRESLFKGTTQDKDAQGKPILRELSDNKEERIAINAKNPFEERLLREVNFGVDVLVEKLLFWNGEVRSTITRPDPSSYKIDHLRGEVYFTGDINQIFNLGVGEQVKGVLLPLDYLDRYSQVSGKNNLQMWAYKGEKFVEYMNNPEGSMKEKGALPNTFFMPYKENGVYLIPRVWATFYYQKDVPFSDLTWEKVKGDSKCDIYRAKEDNYVLIQAKSILGQNPGTVVKAQSRMKSISTDNMWEQKYENENKGYYVHVGSPLSEAVAVKDKYAQQTYVFYHRDERETMEKVGRTYLQPDVRITGSVKLVNLQDIASGPNLGVANLTGHDVYSGESSIAAANLSLGENGFFITLELEKEMFRLGRAPEKERERTIDVYYRIGKYSKGKWARTESPVEARKETVLGEGEVTYDS